MKEETKKELEEIEELWQDSIEALINRYHPKKNKRKVDINFSDTKQNKF